MYFCGVLDVFDFIVDFLEEIWTFISSIFRVGAQYFSMIFSTISLSTSMVTYLPTIIATSVSLVIAAGIVKAIFGR